MGKVIGDLEDLVDRRDNLVKRLDNGLKIIQAAVMEYQAGRLTLDRVTMLNTLWVRRMHEYGDLQHAISVKRAVAVGTPFIDDFGHARRAGGQNLNDFDAWINDENANDKGDDDAANAA